MNKSRSPERAAFFINSKAKVQVIIEADPAGTLKNPNDEMVRAAARKGNLQ